MGSDPILSWYGIVGNSDVMREVFTMVEQVADTDASVLLLGESGTGKELVARAIHQKSSRANKPFVAVNCAALPESVIESELFGHEKGAFTGAFEQRKGRFEQANGGTLFLDEIGELSPGLQVKLLRFLQDHRFERVGGNTSIEANVRVIAATNRNLQELVDQGNFRPDLYYRLNVFPINIPPLRERGADILLLADHFVAKFNRENTKKIQRISTPALDLLMIYHWPGNVRELENCILRAAILSTDGVIHAYHLPPSLQSAASTGTEPSTGLDAAIARLEKELIIEALKLENGNVAAAARRLGATERRVRYAMQRYRIDARRFKTKL
jgi:Nif-specific regulatory protein